MKTLDSAEWLNYSAALAFVGNSLVAPMDETETLGLEPGFWSQFPNFGSVEAMTAIEMLGDFAAQAEKRADAGEDPVQKAADEYHMLFVGEKKPKAAPWEDAYRDTEWRVQRASDFGPSALDMQNLLHEAGLTVSEAGDGHADHMGIELLYTAVLCERMARLAGAPDELLAADTATPEGVADPTPAQIAGFAAMHPLAWIDKLQARVAAACPGGYFENLLALAQALLKSLVEKLNPEP